MEFSIHGDGPLVEVRLKGQLTFAENGAFRDMLRELETHAANDWLLDLSQVDFIDSAGLGLLIIVRELAGKRQAALRLKSPCRQAARLFEVAHMSRLFVIES